MARLLLACIALVACDGGRQLKEHRRDPGALVVAEAAGIIGLDPLRVTDSESIEVGELLFEGLVRWKPGTTDITGGLAKSWSAEADGKTWRFILEDNVVFHDGTPFDAAAVKFSFERLLDPKHPNYIRGEDGAYWRSLLKEVTKVDVIDPRTVVISTSRPYAPLIGNVAMFPIVSPTAVSRWGDAFKDHPIGTGPFAFESWTRGEQVVVHRFDGYWGKRPAIDRIVFRVVVDARQRLVELESGSVDIATSILPDEQSFVELHPDLDLKSTPGNDVSYLAFNTQHPPFDDPRVRRAVAFAINKEPIVKLAYQGRALAADGPLPPTQWGYHKPKTIYSYDLVAARKLLAEAIADKSFDPERVYKLYSLSTPRPYLAQPERVARFSRPRSRRSASRPSSCCSRTAITSAPSRPASTTSACSAGSATPAIPTTFSTCSSTPKTRRSEPRRTSRSTRTRASTASSPTRRARATRPRARASTR